MAGHGGGDVSGYGDMDSGRLPCKSTACPSNSRGPGVQDHGRRNGTMWRLWMGMLHKEARNSSAESAVHGNWVTCRPGHSVPCIWTYI